MHTTIISQNEAFTVAPLSCVKRGETSVISYTFKMKALKCKTLGAEFATELVVGNGRRMNKSQIYVL